jgi:ZIP family zinc transporter
MSRVWLFVLAITIHNFPEGLAVGVSFGVGNITAALFIAMAIGLQNMPEGLAVALPLRKEGYSRRKCLWYATLTGLIEPVGGGVGRCFRFYISSYFAMGASICCWRYAFCCK